MSKIGKLFSDLKWQSPFGEAFLLFVGSLLISLVPVAFGIDDTVSENGLILGMMAVIIVIGGIILLKRWLSLNLPILVVIGGLLLTTITVVLNREMSVYSLLVGGGFGGALMVSAMTYKDTKLGLFIPNATYVISSLVFYYLRDTIALISGDYIIIGVIVVFFLLAGSLFLSVTRKEKRLKQQKRDENE